jgi:predicted aspartyl protease
MKVNGAVLRLAVRVAGRAAAVVAFIVACAAPLLATAPARAVVETPSMDAPARAPADAGAAAGAGDAVVTPDELQEVVVSAPEPRYVAPTSRDRIGRVWVPVLINSRGPFRLVLDSGATHSAVTAQVATRLGIPLDSRPPVMLRGVTGSTMAQAIDVKSIEFGDLYLADALVPIVPDAFGGADGLLGSQGLEDKRIYIDFRHDFINVSRSRNRRADPGFTVVPLQRDNVPLLVVRARVGNVRAKAIIDTGAQASIGNRALLDALARRYVARQPSVDEITGATGDMQRGSGFPVSPIEIGGLEIRDAHVTFGEMHIFSHWQLGEEPAILLGMDVLGLLDTLVIDYRRREIHLRTRGAD